MRTIIIILFLFPFAVLCAVSAQAQKISGNFGGGSIRLGMDTTPCDASRNGAIRYDSAGGKFEGCTGGEWKGLVQQLPQLGSVLYSSVFTETDYNAYNAYISAAQEARANLMAGEGSPAALEAIAWFQSTCLFTDGVIAGQVLSSACGTEYCIAKTGKNPVLVQSLWSCQAGGAVSCNGGNFVVQWSCLTPG